MSLFNLFTNLRKGVELLPFVSRNCMSYTHQQFVFNCFNKKVYKNFNKILETFFVFIYLNIFRTIFLDGVDQNYNLL